MKQDMIVILDLGSTENARVARAVRALGVYSEIYPHDTSLEKLRELPNVKGLVLSGGENRVVDGVEVDVNADVSASDFPKLIVNHPKAAVQDAPVWPQDDEELKSLLSGFVFGKCGAEANWSMNSSAVRWVIRKCFWRFPAAWIPPLWPLF